MKGAGPNTKSREEISVFGLAERHQNPGRQGPGSGDSVAGGDESVGAGRVWVEAKKSKGICSLAMVTILASVVGHHSHNTKLS